MFKIAIDKKIRIQYGRSTTEDSMKLRVYLIEKNITILEFAKTIGIDRTYLGLIANGKKKPSRFLAKEIERATNGEVTAEELQLKLKIN